MTDSDEDKSLMGRLKSSVSSAVDRATGAAGQGLAQLEEQLEAMAPRLADPQNVDRLQKTMSGMAQMLYGLGFRLDRPARLLFELMDWVETNHGRQPVLQALSEHNPLLGPEFLDVIRYAAGGVSPDDQRRKMARQSIDAFRTKGRRQVLRFLAALAATTVQESPPRRDIDELVGYIEASNIPERFKPLAEYARSGPAGSSAPSSSSGTPGEPAHAGQGGSEEESESEGWTGRLKDSVRALTRRGEDAGALVDGLTPIFDRHLRFLSISFLFAAQGFMTRSAIEELPDIVEQSAAATGGGEDDDVIDI